MDVEAFGKKGFDPKRWINEACELKPPEEDMEKCAAAPAPCHWCTCPVWGGYREQQGDHMPV